MTDTDPIAQIKAALDGFLAAKTNAECSGFYSVIIARLGLDHQGYGLRALLDRLDAQDAECERLRETLRLRMDDADSTLAERDAEIEALKHDLGEYQKIVKDLTNENERLWANTSLEPVAMRYDFDGYGWQYIDNGSGSDWQTRKPNAEPLYIAPPEITKESEQAAYKRVLEELNKLLTENNTGVDYTDGCDDCIAAVEKLLNGWRNDYVS